MALPNFQGNHKIIIFAGFTKSRFHSFHSTNFTEDINPPKIKLISHGWRTDSQMEDSVQLKNEILKQVFQIKPTLPYLKLN